MSQTSGEWVHLGLYQRIQGIDSHVEVTNQDGTVVADAVIWVIM